MMTKNPIKFIRNPNSPAAIQARLDGYGDITPFVETHLITDNEANIFIDLTKSKVDQRVNYPTFGGNRQHMNRRLVRTSLHVDGEGQPIITNYYTDVRNQQWIIIKSFLNRPLPSSMSTNPTIPVPRATYGNTFGGFFSSARGETWRNEGKSVDKLRAAQKRLESTVDLDPSADLTKEVPNDHFDDEFTGER